MVGIVHTFNDERGFGFIRVSFKEHYFFHVENWRGAEVPVRGQTVEFDLGAPQKIGQRMQAIKVIPIDGGAQ